MFSTVPVITQNGMTLLLRAAAGEHITLTKFQIGKGTLEPGTDPKTVDALIDIVLDDLPITHVAETEQDGYIELQTFFDNQTNVTEDFIWTEIGLIARVDNEDAEDYQTEYLYAYANDGDNAGTLKAANSDVITEQTISLIIAIGDSENITAYILPNATYASKAAFDEHIAATNPHGTTWQDVGAAAETHNHAASDITSGTIPVLRGGTGATSAANARTNLGAAAAQHNHSASNITSGTLPIERGGTGATTAAAIRSNIGAASVVDFKNVMITTTGWTTVNNSSGTFYSKEISVSGMLYSDKPIVRLELPVISVQMNGRIIPMSYNMDQVDAARYAYEGIFSITTDTDKITVFAEEIPAVTIYIDLLCVRG